MWKKPDAEEPKTQVTPPAPQAALPRSPSAQPRERATIGPTICLKGDIMGEEDLLIEGRVEGKIELRQHNITVGKNGRLNADMYGKVIYIEGEVQGNLYGEVQIVLRQTSTVRGNITAPRVILEDGSNFKGSVDMSDKQTVEQPLPSVAASPPAKTVHIEEGKSRMV